MTLEQRLLAERRAVLAEKLAVVERLSEHLRFSVGRLAYPLAADTPALLGIATETLRYAREADF